MWDRTLYQEYRLQQGQEIFFSISLVILNVCFAPDLYNNKLNLYSRCHTRMHFWSACELAQVQIKCYLLEKIR